MSALKRYSAGIGVAALLCQLFWFPVAGEPVVASSAAETAVADDSLSADVVDYEDYLAGVSDTSATEGLSVAAHTYLQDSARQVTPQDDALLWSDSEGYAAWTVSVPQTGLYTVLFAYAGQEGGGSDIELGLQVDGEYPFAEAKRFTLPRYWTNDGDVRTDPSGNEFAPEQKEEYIRQQYPMRDVNGFISEDLCVYLEAGVHRLALFSYGEPFALYAIELGVPTVTLTREEQLAAWAAAGITAYTGDEWSVEGESAFHKSDRSLIGLSDGSDPGVQPSDAFLQRVNYIGGGNWSLPNETLTWKVDAPAAGLYKLGIHFRQSYYINGTAYRTLKVNGELPYQELGSVAFGYKNDWQFTDTLKDGQEILVYLQEGPNELSLAVTLGDMNTYSAKMEDMVLRLGNMYREIISIIGETPDNQRDYDLFSRIPDLEERMQTLYTEIEALIEERRGADKSIDNNVTLLKKMNVVLKQMLEAQYEAQKYKNNYYDCYASLSSWLQEMKNMALDIDALVFAAPDTPCQRTTSDFFGRLKFGVQRFIASFLVDYNLAKGAYGDRELTLWVNWSRDQTLVLNSLINSSFTPQTGISVTVRMTNASLLQGVMSGNGPDCALSEARTTPVNLAMRGALVDLSEFPDHEEVLQRFMPGAQTPYTYRNKVYGLPSTQQFYMMFYRTDVFEEYGLEVPKTWEEFKTVSSILMLNNLEVGLPYIELTDIYQAEGGVAALNIFPSLLRQYDISLYNEALTATTLTESETIRVFTEWTDYYTRYNFDSVYNFFNRFRIGLMPLAIQSYSQYSVLAAAAPEITGRWEMAGIPGVPQADGSINNSQAGFGSAAVILQLSEDPAAAWELLKWWTSADTQYRYATDIESILGVSGRYATANVEAMLKLDWGLKARNVLRSQWSQVRELPEVPGGYYTSRAIDQAFWNVVSQGENSKDMMKKWGEIADEEIKTKIEQYSEKGEHT